MDANATPWHIQSPLNLSPVNGPLPKFNDHFPKLSVGGTINSKEHLITFSNTFHNIGENDNDTCMRFFINSLLCKVVVDFLELPSKTFSTWDEIFYWFKSTYGEPRSMIDLLHHCNNFSFPKGEDINNFNQWYTNIYNKIPKIIRPQNQATMMHCYSALPPSKLFFILHKKL